MLTLIKKKYLRIERRCIGVNIVSGLLIDLKIVLFRLESQRQICTVTLTSEVRTSHFSYQLLICTSM